MTLGLCQCGCGQATSIAGRTRPEKGWVEGQPLRFLPGHHNRVGPKGPNHPRWRGGRYIDHRGYAMVYRPDHPGRNSSGYVAEHRIVVEGVLGKILRRTAQVHHVNENKTDNQNRNLVACDSLAYHGLLHKRLRAMQACGNPNAHRCERCHGYEDQEGMTVTSRGRAYHRACAAREARERTAAQ